MRIYCKVWRRILRGIFKHINKWKVIIWLWIGIYNIVKYQFSSRGRTSPTGYQDLIESWY